jgi:RNA polymerase primary sigma factor
MPPLAKCKIPEIADLADQVRYASHASLLRQVESAESLAGDLDEQEKYPVDWLVFRITGHRPDSGSAGSAVFSGSAVLADLSAFVERLCESAEFGIADLPDGSVDADGLAARWNVSRKTIDRSRRKGLIARRVRNERGRASLYFSPRSVAAYEGRRGEAIEKAGAFSRLSPDTEARIIRRAARYRRVFHCTLNQAAVRLAEKFDRSHQGIRELLERHDARERERGGEPIFEERPDRSARTQIVAVRMSRAGAEPAEIAHAIFGPRADKRRATRLIRQARARLLRRLNLDGPVSPAFARADADEVLLAPDCVRTGLGGGPGATDLPGLIGLIHEASPMSAADESARAVAHQYLRSRARRMLEKLSETDPNPTRLDEIETRLRWAMLLRTELVRAELGVLGTTVERQIGRSMDRLPPHQVRPLLIVGLRAIGEAVDRFAPFHGGRLAGAVSMRVGKAITREIDDEASGFNLARRRPATGAAMPDLTRMWPGIAWAAWLAPLPGLREAYQHLSGRDRLIIGRRAGFDGEAPETITELAERLETTRMHAARYERAAVREALRVHRERVGSS